MGADPAARCGFPLEFEVVVLSNVKVFVDCVEVPRCDDDTECWVFGDSGYPVVLNDALCSRLADDGFTVIEIFERCSAPFT